MYNIIVTWTGCQSIIDYWVQSQPKASVFVDLEVRLNYQGSLSRKLCIVAFNSGLMDTALSVPTSILIICNQRRMFNDTCFCTFSSYFLSFAHFTYLADSDYSAITHDV